MEKVIVDKEMLAKLRNLQRPLELCDEQGHKLATVQPDPSRDRELWRTIEIPVSEEELQLAEQQMREGKGHTTAEVLAHLKSLEKL